MVKIKHCHHHSFTVSDLDRSLAFYHEVLGLEVVRVSERSNLPSYDQMLGYSGVKLRVALLRHPVNEFLLELFQYINPPSTPRELRNHYVGSSHVAFEVEDIDTVYLQLKSAGYGAINAPVDIVRDGLSVEIFQEFADVVTS